MLILPCFCLLDSKLELLFEGFDPVIKVFNFIFVGLLDLVKITIQLWDIFIVLGLEAVNCVEKLDLIFTLDYKDLILKSADVGFQIILSFLVLFNLFLIAFE